MEDAVQPKAPATPQGVFALPEYDRGARQHVLASINALTRARSPLLSAIRSEACETLPNSVIADASGRELVIKPAAVQMRFAVDIDPVVAGDLASVYGAIDSASEQQEEGVTKAMLGSLSSITEFTGNTIDAEGKPISWDLITDAFEQMEIGFETGKPDVTLVMNPRDLERLQQLDPPTPEQQSRHDAVLARKRAEWDARQRSRRLE